jgi:V/A-type H+-transporting ATPase subunit D
MSQILDVNPTRMELLNLKEKKILADKGYNLLKNKQDALIMRFFEKVKEIRTISGEVNKKVSSAFESLTLAQALDGVPNIKTAAFNYPISFNLEVSTQNIMGVKVQKIDMHKKQIGIEHIGSSNQLIETQKKFNDLVINIVKYAELEDTLRKLADDIKKTKRRLNSLEFIKIPALIDTYNYIKMYLGEQERENFFRLKTIKAQIEMNEELEELKEMKVKDES